MRVLLIDDHPLFAQGLTFLLAELAPDVGCATARSVREALAQPGPFDLVLLDFNLPGVTGLEALAEVRAHFDEVPTVLLSGEEKPDVIRAAIDGGAMGYVPKSSTPAVLLAALRLVLAGGCYLPAQLLAGLWPESAAAPAPELGALPTAQGRTAWAERLALTERQLAVLQRAIQGKSNKVIARETNLAEGTVKAHLSTAFRVLGARNRTEAVFRAAQLGMNVGER
ncbi:response regulator transcription factor [Pseudacidovorax sp. RU35E]|uniref:response regulator n=1 Tax=Pseudacidovorax sp. RU35E TaxID=1907403 RepID=UPI000954AD46|nr:response regulator transcription factor [Pseudacidovorax sp. RU35E]SIP90312.1 DNA-binding response regulator, NarL/FixJ family, contains REC and HTH domains [Pseudacidovorax sp. RU35E]